MKCKNARLCNNFVISSSVTLTGGVLIINVPAGYSFLNCSGGCLAIAQNIDATVPLGTPVVVTIGDGTTQYPLIDRRGIQVTASSLDTRTRYPFRVITSVSSAVFKLCANTRCPSNILPGIPV